jgi:hypothetical protein
MLDTTLDTTAQRWSSGSDTDRLEREVQSIFQGALFCSRAALGIPHAKNLIGHVSILSRRVFMFSRIARAIEWLVGADVHRSERRIVGVFFVNLLLLLTAYYILKVVREPLILVTGGAVSRSYAPAAQAFLLIVLVPLYSLLANRYEPAKLVDWVNGFFIGSLGIFAALGAAGTNIGFAFYIWLGIFSTWLLAAEHREPSTFPPHFSRRKVQGQGGHRYIHR